MPWGFLGVAPWTFQESNLRTQAPVRVTQAGLEPWVIDTPDFRVTQIGVEAWSHNPSFTPSFGALSQIGPTGLLGVPIRRFRESTLAGPDAAPTAPTDLQVTQVGLEVWGASYVRDTFDPTPRWGPGGMFNFPGLRFQEQPLNAGLPPPPMQVTQAGLEPWVRDTPVLNVTQAGLEPWVRDTPVLQVTQIGLEIWGPPYYSNTFDPRPRWGPGGMFNFPGLRFKEAIEFPTIPVVRSGARRHVQVMFI